MSARCLISHDVRYSSLSWVGISGMACTEPLCAMIWLRISGVHSPASIRSRSRCWLTTVNSPESTRREYRLDVYGSKHSLLPRICAVDAVGIGARSSELRTPCVLILARSAAQSHRGEGVTPHMSCCSTPLLTGLAG